jgi:hypothetical protein
MNNKINDDCPQTLLTNAIVDLRENICHASLGTELRHVAKHLDSSVPKVTPVWTVKAVYPPPKLEFIDIAKERHDEVMRKLDALMHMIKELKNQE